MLLNPLLSLKSELDSVLFNMDGTYYSLFCLSLLIEAKNSAAGYCVSSLSFAICIFIVARYKSIRYKCCYVVHSRRVLDTSVVMLYIPGDYY
jgi:hypothetical protein